MSIGKLKKVTIKEKEYELEAFSKITVYNKIKKFETEEIEVTGIDPSQVVKLILTGTGNYLYGKDKIVYRAYADSFDFFYDYPISFRYPVKILNVFYKNMADAYFIYDKSQSIITDFYEEFAKCSSASSVIFYKGRLVFLGSNSLSISGPFQYLDGSVSTKFTYLSIFSTVKFGYGEAIIEIKSGVYVITSKRILYLYIGKTFDEYLFDELNFPVCEVCPGSVLKFGQDKILFINHCKLNIFDGTTLKTVNTLLDQYENKQFMQFCCDEFSYYLTFQSGANTYTYVYNVVTGEELIDKYYNLVCEEKPYFYDETQNKISLLKIVEEQIEKEEGTLETKEDLGTCLDKIITGFEIHIEGSAELQVSGNFGEKTFKLEAGCNNVRCNLNSKEFSFKIQNQSSDFVMIRAKIKYRTCGE